MSTKMSETEELLRQYISENELKTGDRLPTHQELASLLGVGSRPLREALSVLQRQGLVETRGRGGTVVSRPQDEHIIEPIRWYFEVMDVTDTELITARAVIESALAGEACKNRTLKDLLLMEQWIEKQAQPDISGAEEMEFDKNFHLTLMDAAHNKVFAVFAKLTLIEFDVLYQTNLYEPHDPIRIEDHTDILTAVYERNEERARGLVRKHVLRALDTRDLQAAGV